MNKILKFFNLTKASNKLQHSLIGSLGEEGGPQPSLVVSRVRAPLGDPSLLDEDRGVLHACGKGRDRTG